MLIWPYVFNTYLYSNANHDSSLSASQNTPFIIFVLKRKMHREVHEAQDAVTNQPTKEVMLQRNTYRN